jgi:hypothetical protein
LKNSESNKNFLGDLSFDDKEDLENIDREII